MHKTLNRSHIKEIFKPRQPGSHKGTHGHALLIAGSKGKMGAAVIGSKACLRSGCGLLTCLVPAEERSIIQSSIPEAMLAFGKIPVATLQRFKAIGIGPGIGIKSDGKEILSHVIKNGKAPLVLDADAITILSRDAKLLKSLPAGTILTPHVKEFDRLYGEHDTDEKRMATAISISKKIKLIIVLKNAETLITHEGNSYLSKTGNSGLAKGGSGDALTGMILSFLAQGYTPFAAAQIGVFLHGLAAEITLKDQSVESMLISDVIENIGRSFKDIYS